MDDRMKCGWVCLLFCVEMTCSAAFAGTWRQHTFADFREGSSDDGGVNLYAAADDTIRSVYTWDYNQDGQNDVVFICGHNNNHAPPAYIYTNETAGFDARFRWLLLNDGAYGGTLSDLNGDGWPEAVLCGTSNGMNSVALDAIVYSGSPQGYSPRRSMRLPTYQSRAVTVLDVNADGRPDLVFGQGRKPGAIVYYNSDGGFDRCRRETTDCAAVSCCAAADVNADGKPDLLLLAGSRLLMYLAPVKLQAQPQRSLDVKGAGRFAVGDIDGDGHADLAVTHSEEQGGAVVYFGDGRGEFAARPPGELPGLSTRDVAVADLNRDGKAEVILANFGNDNATGDAPSVIFWGSAEGPSPEKSTALNTRFTHGLATADLNGDGWPDLIVCCHRGAESFNVESYVYFSDAGRFSDDRRQALPTLGAVAAAVGDVDRNGKPDVLFLNSTDGTVGLMDSRIYWNDGLGNFSTDRMTLVPTKDPFGHVGADLNLDGQVDLVFPGSYEYGRFREEGSQVYWGAASNTPVPSASAYRPGVAWSEERRSLLPTNFATGIVAADLNRDGWLDLACAQIPNPEGTADDQKRNRCPIFWGSREGYSAERISRVSVENPRGLTLGDLNKDGWLDLIYTNLDHDDVVIFWGSSGGYSDDQRSRLPVPNNGAVCVDCADVNGDGWLDVLIVCIYDYSHPEDITSDRDSYIYLGGPSGFDASRRMALPTVGGDQATVADFDRDGRLDVCIGNYTNNDRDRTWSSYIYYNSPAGFSPARRTGLFTNAGSGNLALDFNNDGWLDIAMACHKKPNGDHRAQSFVFWGSSAGFDDYRKVELPTNGAHETTLVDAGHIYHRRFETVWTSGAHDVGQSLTALRIAWKGETPHGSRLRFQIRTAEGIEALEHADWCGPAGPGSWFEGAGTTADGRPGRWVQYRALFVSRDGSNYPILRDVQLEW